MVIPTATQADVEKYCRSIEKQLRSNGLAVDEIYPIIRNDIYNRVADKPIVTIEMLVREFGTPESYVQAHFDSMPSDECRKAVELAKSRRKIWLITAISIVLIVTMVVVGLAFGEWLRNAIKASDYVVRDLEAMKLVGGILYETYI